MTFLSKFGSLVSKFIKVLTGFGPLVSTEVPSSGGVISTLQGDLEKIAGFISEVESIGQALGVKGEQKLLAAAPLVAQVILHSALLVGHKVHDEALFNTAAKKIADGMADLLNSLDQDSVKQA